MVHPLDDDAPKTVRPTLKNLDPLSIEDLESYIEALNAEIDRARATISARRAIRGGAEALFKSKS
jgi:uncharacterized small protein (DUF1192 family)